MRPVRWGQISGFHCCVDGIYRARLSVLRSREAQIDAAVARYAGIRGSAVPKKERQCAANSNAIGLRRRLAKVASTSRLLLTATLKRARHQGAPIVGHVVGRLGCQNAVAEAVPDEAAHHFQRFGAKADRAVRGLQSRNRDRKYSRLGSISSSDHRLAHQILECNACSQAQGMAFGKQHIGTQLGQTASIFKSPPKFEVVEQRDLDIVAPQTGNQVLLIGLEQRQRDAGMQLRQPCDQRRNHEGREYLIAAEGERQLAAALLARAPLMKAARHAVGAIRIDQRRSGAGDDEYPARNRKPRNAIQRVRWR